MRKNSITFLDPKACCRVAACLAVAAAAAWAQPITLFEGYSVSSVNLNGTVSLYFGVSPGVPLSNFALTDSLPANLVVASNPELINGCGGILIAIPGTSLVTLTVPALSLGCTTQVAVTAIAGGAFLNTVTAISDQGTGSATATLTVTAPLAPVITESFATGTVGMESATAMTLTITNPNSTATLTNVGFIDTMSAVLQIFNAPVVQAQCGSPASSLGNLLVQPGSLVQTGGTLVPLDSCMITTAVIGQTLGLATNTTGNVSSANGGTGNETSASVTVASSGPPTSTVDAWRLPIEHAIARHCWPTCQSAPYHPPKGDHCPSPFLSDFAVQAGVNQFYDGPVTKSSVLYTGPAPAPHAFSGGCGGSIDIPVSNSSIYIDLGADWAGRPQCYRIPSPIPGAVLPQSGAGGVSQSYAGGAGGNLMGGPTSGLTPGYFGGAGGCGGSIMLSSTRGSIVVNGGTSVGGGINTSDRGASGGLVPGPTWGTGGSGGCIPVTASPSLTIQGTVLAAGGQDRQNHDWTVSTLTGSLYWQSDPLQTNGTELTIPLIFSLDSGASNTDGPFGFGANSSYRMKVNSPVPGTFNVVRDNGEQAVFGCPTSGPCTSPNPAGHFRASTTAGNMLELQQTGPNANTSKVNLTNGNLTAIGGSAVSQTLTYDASGNLLSVNDTSGRSLHFASDANGHVTSVKDSLGRMVLFTYDTSGNLNQFTDALGNNTQFLFDANHRLIQVADPRGNLELRATYDSQGRVTQMQDALNFTTGFAYASGGTTITDPLGNTTLDTYDSNGRLMAVRDALGNSTTVTRDVNNLITSLTDARGNTWNFTYDGDGNMTGMTDPLGKTISQTFDTNDNLLTSTDQLGHTTTFTYDSDNDVTQVEYADGSTDNFTYAGPHRAATWTNANGAVTNYSYSAAGDLTGATDALSGIWKIAVDAAGRPLSVTDPLSHTTKAVYDNDDDVTRIADPLGHSTLYAYDANGNPVSVTDADGNTTKYTYDARNQLSTTMDALNNVAALAYDRNGNPTGYSDFAGHNMTYTYTVVNQLMEATDPLGNTNQFVYDAVGNRTAITDGNGKTNTFTYDGLNRQTAANLFDNTKIAYTYNAVGNLAAMTDTTGQTSYTYDLLNRLTSAATPDGATVGLGYDSVGNRVSLTLPNLTVDTYTFDLLNRMTQAMDGAGSKTAYTYDAGSRLTGTTLANGASSAYKYDAAGRPTSVVNEATGAKVISSFSYVLDPVGNKLKAIAAGKTTTYGYDVLYRLTSSTPPSGQTTTYTYDAAGNRTQVVQPTTPTNYAYDTANRMTAAGAAALVSDDNGNLVNDGTLAYKYDALNRLISVKGSKVNAQYQYDGLGRRVGQQAGAQTMHYVNDPVTGQVLTQSGTAGTETYFFGVGRVSATGTSPQTYYQYDASQNVASVTGATGALLTNYTYQPFGQATASVAGVVNLYRFAAEPVDPQTGFIYMEGSYYSPSWGRLFGGATLAGSPNEYLYQGSNPVR